MRKSAFSKHMPSVFLSEAFFYSFLITEFIARITCTTPQRFSVHYPATRQKALAGSYSISFLSFIISTGASFPIVRDPSHNVTQHPTQDDRRTYRRKRIGIAGTVVSSSGHPHLLSSAASSDPLSSRSRDIVRCDTVVSGRSW
jgi:hypothetical protein